MSEETPIKPPGIVYEPGIEWKVYCSAPVKLYVGYEPSKDMYYAASEGPPYFNFIPGSWNEIEIQLSIVIELYGKVLKEKTNSTSM